MSNEELTFKCGNPECRVSETGRCVEGFELDKCLQYGREPEEISEEEEIEDADVSTPFVQLRGAETLSLEDASKLLRAAPTRVIAIVGPSDSGKTSLIAGLYELFQEGPIGDISFSRSTTLHAFEQTCHDARSASRRTTPHIHRTRRGEVRFYHLDISGAGTPKFLTLALADRAGEEYKGAADDASAGIVFPEIQRADTLTLLVDGHRHLDSGARHNLRSEIIMIIQALVDGGALQNGQRLAVVLTKIDQIVGNPNEERALTEFSKLVTKIGELFPDTFTKIVSFKIAASPKSGGMRRGTGVAELLDFWKDPAPPLAEPAILTTTPKRAFARLRQLDE
ncbi:hypothetical protein DFS28_101336 [Pseudomonas sp. 478]|uniref:TRAFAC clade GTPase domain-containing protein n=1 Tax=unclassified Pseudomonas TaxID=196821 RepID=UPI000DB54844|nr:MULTISPECIES: hypothetical protein [unclassified Pseudomonas]PZX01986.1 hypothetical protein DFS28_101336 [Pseudomonas sp. 478]TCV52083.1 hypothetical protein EDB99_106120 [Pseudomonas sp. 460]